jgi:hypothetical protein
MHILVEVACHDGAWLKSQIGEWQGHAFLGHLNERPIENGDKFNPMIIAYAADPLQALEAGANREKKYLLRPVVLQGFLDKIV